MSIAFTGRSLAIVVSILIAEVGGGAAQAPDRTGLIIEDVAADSLAARHGMQAGDRLLTYDNRPLSSPAALLAAIENTFGTREAALRIRRAGEILTLGVPVASLGIDVRPDLVAVALGRYEEGRSALRTQRRAEAIGHWVAAADIARQSGDSAGAAWLRMRAGEVHEQQRRWEEARAAYASAFATLPASADAASKSHLLSAIGRCSRRLSDFSAAENNFQQALATDTAAGHEMWAARDLSGLGSIAYSRGNLSAAQDYESRALAVKNRVAPDSLDVAGSLNGLGALAWRRGDLAAAQDYFTRALAIRERLAPASPDIGTSLGNLGAVAYSRGDLPAAQDYFTRSLAFWERVAPESVEVAAALSNLAAVLFSRGNITTAHDCHVKALAIHERLAPNSLNHATTLTNLGNVAWTRGDLPNAEDYHRRSLAIRGRLAPDSLDVASSLTNLGNVAHDRGDTATAQTYHRRALAIRERLAPDSLEVATSLVNLGKVARVQADYAAARTYYTKALAIQERLGPASLDLAIVFNNLGNVAQEQGDNETAESYHRRALALRERLAPSSLDVAMSLVNLGNVVRAYDARSAEARDYYERALVIQEQWAPDSLGTADTLANAGDLAFHERRFADAQTLFARATTIVEAQRRQIASADARAFLVAQYPNPYRGLLRTLVAIGDEANAFAVLERARARSLVDLLAERRLDFRSDAPSHLAAEQEALDEKRSAASAARTKATKELIDLRTRIRALDPNTDRDQLPRLEALRQAGEKRLDAVREELTGVDIAQRDLEARLRKVSPKLAALQYPEPLDLMGAQRALDPDTLLLAYQVDKDEIYLFAVSKTGVTVFTLPIDRAALERDVTLVRELVGRQRLGNLTEVARRLYRTLLGPTQDLINQAKRVLICPDGPLQVLPFAALVSRTEPRVRYFIEDKPLHMVSSMTVYAETRRWASETTTAVNETPIVLAFGDPVYVKEKDNVTTNSTETASLQRRGLSLAPLPRTRDEVTGIVRLFGRSARARLGAEATETAAKREAPSASILHFAAHGWMDETLGLSSGLVLTQPEAVGRTPSAEDDGLLQAWEIFEQLRVNADLVVLSACQTALGQNLRGEGLIGLTRAFLYAGARSVVVSLWDVSDSGTAEFMQTFYRELRSGKSKDVALQTAMVTVARTPERRHPFYWAPFVLAGDWR
jgi:CHAT domain-containing protein